jgi:hypothetical protein
MGMAAQSVSGPVGIMSGEEAVRLLGSERLEKLGLSVFKAFERYKSAFAPAMAKPPARFRATAVNALMVEEAEKVFAGEVIHRYGRALVCSIPGIVLQFKKLDRRGLPRNYPTKTAIRFANQQRVPGIPEGTRVTVGYILNEMQTEISEVRLVAQRGDTVVWNIELIVSQTVMPIFAPTTKTIPAEAAAPKKRRLQAKSGARKVRKPQG